MPRSWRRYWRAALERVACAAPAPLSPGAGGRQDAAARAGAPDRTARVGRRTVTFEMVGADMIGGRESRDGKGGGDDVGRRRADAAEGGDGEGPAEEEGATHRERMLARFDHAVEDIERTQREEEERDKQPQTQPRTFTQLHDALKHEPPCALQTARQPLSRHASIIVEETNPPDAVPDRRNRSWFAQTSELVRRLTTSHAAPSELKRTSTDELLEAYSQASPQPQPSIAASAAAPPNPFATPRNDDWDAVCLTVTNPQLAEKDASMTDGLRSHAAAATGCGATALSARTLAWAIAACFLLAGIVTMALLYFRQIVV